MDPMVATHICCEFTMDLIGNLRFSFRTTLSNEKLRNPQKKCRSNRYRPNRHKFPMAVGEARHVVRRTGNLLCTRSARRFQQQGAFRIFTSIEF